MKLYNKLKAEEIRANLANEETRLQEIATKDDANYTLMFAVGNLMAAIKELDRSINRTVVEFPKDDTERMSAMTQILGLKNE